MKGDKKMTYNFVASSERADRRNDEAHVEFSNYHKKVKAGQVIEIDGLQWTVETVKRIWEEDEMRTLVQTNDKVLYGALKQLYACQTADEQCSGETRERNGAGFNGVDSGILSSIAEFLNKNGFLTDKQKALVRKKMVKYNKQLVRLANA